MEQQTRNVLWRGGRGDFLLSAATLPAGNGVQAAQASGVDGLTLLLR